MKNIRHMPEPQCDIPVAGKQICLMLSQSEKGWTFDILRKGSSNQIEYVMGLDGKRFILITIGMIFSGGFFGYCIFKLMYVG